MIYCLQSVHHSPPSGISTGRDQNGEFPKYAASDGRVRVLDIFWKYQPIQILGNIKQHIHLVNITISLYDLIHYYINWMKIKMIDGLI